MKQKVCSVCGDEFGCGVADVGAACWCSDLPMIMPLDFSQDCRCPKCLTLVIKQYIDEFVSHVTPQNALEMAAKIPAHSAKQIEGIDYYINEDGYFVFTAWHHLKRGHCCKNGCKHCPYGFKKLQK